MNELMMADPKCPDCGATIPETAPAGQCVRCALSLLFDPSLVGDGSSGRRVGPYELVEKLGEGGMGVVWKARHQQLNRLVALKQIKAGFLASSREVERFRSEMETVARLDHPHIVPVYDFGEDLGQHFCTMRLLDGGTLATRLADPNVHFSSTDAARLVAILAQAVQHAHQRGVIHRDLKPSNILLDSNGQPHIADFGLAKRLDADRDFTASGVIQGSVHYLSPEQAAGDSKRLTIATDIYALGVILYEVLAGRPPFVADTIPALFRKIAEDAPRPPSHLRPTPKTAAHRDLETITLKCLAKDPARRYATAADLAEDLERWIRREPISARPPTPWERAINVMRRHPVRTGLALVALLGLALTATFAYASHRTYSWLMAKIAAEHLIVPPNEDGTFLLHFHGDTPDRCTYNLWKDPFGSYYDETRNGRFARLQFSGLPPEVADTLQVRVFSDVPGAPDVARTPVLTNGATFFLDMGQRHERAFYFAPKNFVATNIVALHPDAAIRVILLGRPGDSDPYRPAGKLESRERQ